jgi:hypothetical protein
LNKTSDGSGLLVPGGGRGLEQLKQEVQHRDSQIPIADAYVLLEHGDARDAWINAQGGHMRRSQWPSSAIAAKVLMPWMMRRLKQDAL